MTTQPASPPRPENMTAMKQTQNTSVRLRLELSPTPRIVRSYIKRCVLGIEQGLRQQLRDACDGLEPFPILIIGGVGTGKTCAALALMDYVFGGRMYETTGDLVSKINDSRMNSERSGVERQFWKEWREAKLTILDEIGARSRVSDSHYETVKRAIDLRIGKPAIFISNLTIAEIANIYDDRIASRLQDGMVINLFDKHDRRNDA